MIHYHYITKMLNVKYRWTFPGEWEIEKGDMRRKTKEFIKNEKSVDKWNAK